MAVKEIEQILSTIASVLVVTVIITFFIKHTKLFFRHVIKSNKGDKLDTIRYLRKIQNDLSSPIPKEVQNAKTSLYQYIEELEEKFFN